MRPFGRTLFGHLNVVHHRACVRFQGQALQFFLSKEDLFRVVVYGRCDEVAGQVDQSRLEGGDLRMTLIRFVPLVRSDEFIATDRMMISDSALSRDRPGLFRNRRQAPRRPVHGRGHQVGRPA